MGLFIYAFWPVSAQKQRIAEEVASILKLSVEIDTSDRCVHLPSNPLMIGHKR